MKPDDDPPSAETVVMRRRRSGDAANASNELLEAVRTAINISKGVRPTPYMIATMATFIVHAGPVLVDLLDCYESDGARGALPGSLCTEITKWEAKHP